MNECLGSKWFSSKFVGCSTIARLQGTVGNGVVISSFLMYENVMKLILFIANLRFGSKFRRHHHSKPKAMNKMSFITFPYIKDDEITTPLPTVPCSLNEVNLRHFEITMLSGIAHKKYVNKHKYTIAVYMLLHISVISISVSMLLPWMYSYAY